MIKIEAVSTGDALSWRSITDRILNWTDHPELYYEEGMRQPEESVLRMAYSVARGLSHKCPPERAIQTVRGGIVFEWPDKFTVRVEPWG